MPCQRSPSSLWPNRDIPLQKQAHTRMPGLVSPGKDTEAALVTRRLAKWSPDSGQAYFQGTFWRSVGGALRQGRGACVCRA